MPKAAQDNSGLNINLLPKEVEVEKNSFLRWLLTAGRYLVILTEVVAIGTFIFSIYLSKQKNDLRDSITSTEIQVKQFQNCDPIDTTAFCQERFLRTQSQINQVSTIRTILVRQNKVITEFFSLLPSSLTLTNLTINEGIITFTGSFPAEQQLQTLVDSFNHSNKINQLDITSLTKGTTFNFTAAAVVNQASFTGGQ